MTIDKPLSILGDPVCNFELFSFVPGIQLAGPGSGTVLVAGLDIHYAFIDSNGVPSFSGGGFDEVVIVDSSIVHNNQAQSGLIVNSYPAVELADVARLSVVGSTLLGGPAGTDACLFAPGTLMANGRAGIDAPNTDVLVFDSTITGGRGGDPVETTAFPCPASLDPWGGGGGEGIVAKSAHLYSTVVSGGNGVEWRSDLTGTCSGSMFVSCGTKAGGAPIVASGSVVDESCSRFGAVGASAYTPSPGGTITFFWDGMTAGCFPDLGSCVGGCAGLLYLSLAAPTAPLPLFSGHAYLDPTSLFRLATFSATAPAPALLTFNVPANAALVGAPWSAQVLVTNGTLSAPVFGTVL